MKATDKAHKCSLFFDSSQFRSANGTMDRHQKAGFHLKLLAAENKKYQFANSRFTMELLVFFGRLVFLKACFAIQKIKG